VYIIENRMALGVYIGGREFPIEVNGFTHCQILTTMKYYLPVLNIQLIDSYNLLKSDITLSDGTSIQIKLGKDTTSTISYNFRVFTIKITNQGPVNLYNIYAYYDYPAFLQQPAVVPLTGNSSDVISKIGEKFNIPVEVDPSNDYQRWTTDNSRYCLYARNVTAHAYLDENSLFLIGTTLTGKIRYKNIQAYTHVNNPKVSYAGYTQNYIPIVDHRILTSSGFMNSSTGYGHSFVIQDSVISVEDSVNVKRVSNDLAMHKGVKGVTEDGQIEVSPIIIGAETHTKYQRAKYQNNRLSSLYTQGIEFMSIYMSDLDILDPCKVLVPQANAQSSPDLDPVHSGNYVVGAKVIFIQGANYYEKFQAWSVGQNSDPAGTKSQA